MKLVYLDNAAATPIDSRVIRAMAAASRLYGNPSSFNDAGRLARTELEKSRKVIADFLGARVDEIIFTASGSEANNLALMGTLSGLNGIVLTTPIEHPSVLEPLRYLKNITTKYIPVDHEGLIDLLAFSKILSADCRLVSVMYANNEIGTIEPIRKISKIIKQFKLLNSGTHEKAFPLFHVDACQAAGYLDMNVQRLGADLVTFNGSKIYGPRGIGVLYVRRGVSLAPLMRGGSQERGLRAGTENLSAIVGLAKAISLIKTSAGEKVSAVRDYAIAKIQNELPDVLLNGPHPSLKLRRAGVGDDRLANNINICIPGLESEVLLLELDKHGIRAGSGSACTSHAVEPSHVLKAIGVPKTHINGALRFSLGRETTKKDIDYLVKALMIVVSNLRKRYHLS